MRVTFAAIVVVSVALAPGLGEANPITPGSLPPGPAADGHNSGAPGADPWAAAGFSSLLDESGDPILLASSFSAFDPPVSHGKLRGGPWGGGIVFVPTFGPASGTSWSFGGPWGGTPGGPSSGLPPFGSFTLLSLMTQDPPPGPDPGRNLGLGAGPGPEFGFGSTRTFSLEPCCEDETPTVPEPSTMLLVGSGLLLGLKRVVRSRSASTTTRP